MSFKDLCPPCFGFWFSISENAQINDVSDVFLVKNLNKMLTSWKKLMHSFLKIN